MRADTVVILVYIIILSALIALFGCSSHVNVDDSDSVFLKCKEKNKEVQSITVVQEDQLDTEYWYLDYNCK